MKKLFLAFCIFILCFGIYAFYEARVFLNNPVQISDEEVFFDVPNGANLNSVAKSLYQQGLITNTRYFIWLTRIKGWQNRLQAGRFSLNKSFVPEKILDILVNGRPVLFRITVPEGLTWWQTGELLEKSGLISIDDFCTIIMDKDFLVHYGIPFQTAEGFLMPDTYLLKKAENPDKETLKAQTKVVIGRMIDNFWKKAQEVWLNGKKPDKDELKKIVILASIVEKETAFDSERAKVAGVYINRLKRNMLLQADPTVIYGLGPNFDGNLRKKNLEDPNNLYNTYQRIGLTPGPICSFGILSLKAAIFPEEHDYLYFVAKTDGGEHAFSKNLADHNRAVRQYLQNRKKK